MTKSAMSKVKPLKFKKLYFDVDYNSYNGVLRYFVKVTDLKSRWVFRSPTTRKTENEAISDAKRIAASFGAELVDMREK